jgi:predicted P-loop ATPase
MMDQRGYISLTKRQLEFLIGITEIKDPMAAVERFVDIMVEEGVDPVKIGQYINKILDRQRKK